MVRSTKGLVRKMRVEDPEFDWEEGLPQIQGAINFTVSRSTGLSPAEIFLGTPPAAVLPDEVELAPPLLRDASPEEVQGFLGRVRQRIQRLKEQAQQAE
jgi:hypothetical protein